MACTARRLPPVGALKEQGWVAERWRPAYIRLQFVCGWGIAFFKRPRSCVSFRRALLGGETLSFLHAFRLPTTVVPCSAREKADHAHPVVTAEEKVRSARTKPTAALGFAVRVFMAKQVWDAVRNTRRCVLVYKSIGGE